MIGIIRSLGGLGPLAASPIFFIFSDVQLVQLLENVMSSHQALGIARKGRVLYSAFNDDLISSLSA